MFFGFFLQAAAQLYGSLWLTHVTFSLIQAQLPTEISIQTAQIQTRPHTRSFP